MAASFLLALEGGGTRSQAAVLDLQGRLLALVDGSEVNTNFTPFEKAQQAVQSAVQEVLHRAGIPGNQVDLIASALVGPRFGAETFAAFCPRAAYRYFSERDVVFARAGIYAPHGVALVAATGATAFAIRADDGRARSFGGWGSLLGDEGSAYALGLEGLRAAARVYEGREPDSGLVEAVCRHFGVSRETFFADLVRLAYHKPLSRAEIAAFAPPVVRLAAQGDAVSQRLVERAAQDLTGLALHAARYLFTPAEVFDVVIAGGMTRAGELILAPLRLALADSFPRAALMTGDAPPAQALGLLAIKKEGTTHNG